MNVLLTAVAVALATTSCATDPPSAAVSIEAGGCDVSNAAGNGLIVAPGLVLTSAHVLKGSTEIVVSRDDRSTTATIVAFDPNMDLAYLAIEPSFGGTIPMGDGDTRNGDRGTAYVFRSGTPVRVPVVFRRPINIRTEDIYRKGETNRPGFELDADLKAGDSGGVVIVNGEAVGVLWARSRNVDHRAYAIDPVEAGALIRAQLDSGEIDDPIDLARCY